MVIDHVTFSCVGTWDVTYAGSVKEAVPVVRDGRETLYIQRVEMRN